MNQPLFGPGGQGHHGSSRNRVREGFNHFSDLFSEFTKHISPAFNHERPERSVQMRLYTMHKGQHLLIFIMFLCLFLIALLMGMAGPKIISEHQEMAKDLDQSKLPAGPFLMMTPRLNAYRRQLWISAQLVTKVEKGQERFEKDVAVWLRVEGILDSGHKVLVGGQGHNRTRTIKCNQTRCDSFIVMHLGVLEYPRYLINISFTGLEIVDRHFDIEDVVFTSSTYNPSFTEEEVWFRFFFVLFTSVVLVFYFYFSSLRQFSLESWSYEQKWTGCLLVLLMFFNNPAFSHTIMTSNPLPGAFDAICQTTFMFALLLFWLCIFHGLRQIERPIYRFYLPKLLLVGTMWFSAMTLVVLQEINEMRDPSFSYQLNTAHFQNFQLYFSSMLAVYVLYMIYLALRAFGELRAMNFLDARLKFHAASLSVVLFLTMSIMAGRYGRGLLEDNLVAKMYTSYTSEGQFLAFYTVLNCYVYVLAYAYSPTSAQLKQNDLLRDNPTFSMINESDDDDETGAMLINTAEPNAGEENVAMFGRKVNPGSLGHNSYDSD